MTAQSMTGFGRAKGVAQGQSFVWELRSVNGRGLDVRLKLPFGAESLEPEVRSKLAASFARGSLSVSLTLETSSTSIQVNEALLEAYAAQADRLHQAHGYPLPSSAEMLSLRGVLDSGGSNDGLTPEQSAALLAGLDAAIAALAASRRDEGARLAATLDGHLDRIEALRSEAQGHAAGQSAAQKQKLSERLDELLGGRAGLDPARLEQEVALLALKADVTEELDRLAGHVTAARALLAQGGAAGRKLDFLVQEFNRETNTLCSKSASMALTRLGLDLKAVIDQLREQVQNLE